VTPLNERRFVVRVAEGALQRAGRAALLAAARAVSAGAAKHQPLDADAAPKRLLDRLEHRAAFGR
jgi:hypothetical protein